MGSKLIRIIVEFNLFEIKIKTEIWIRILFKLKNWNLLLVICGLEAQTLDQCGYPLWAFFIVIASLSERLKENK